MRIEDNNGSFTYSNIVLIRSAQAGTIRIYPNPATNMFTLNVPQSLVNSSVRITDAKGAILLRLTMTNTQENIDISMWSSGIYFIRFEDGTKKTLLKK